MNHSRQLFPMTGAVLAVLLLSSCASSERMNRMSGILGSYEKPRGERIAGFPARESGDTLSPLDDSLINLWPFFYRNHLYTSLLWPMIDSDPYGFAVRPFYNQEGNEYSVLFPLCAWNPVNGDGWLANVYWNRKGFGAFPLFHHPRNPQELACYTLFWRCGGNYGIFPLARFGTGIVIPAPRGGSAPKSTSQAGFFPLHAFRRKTIPSTTRDRSGCGKNPSASFLFSVIRRKSSVMSDRSGKTLPITHSVFSRFSGIGMRWITLFFRFTAFPGTGNAFSVRLRHGTEIK